MKALKIYLLLVVLCLLAPLSSALEEENHIGKFGIGFDISMFDEGTDGLTFYGGAHVRLRFNETIALEGSIDLRNSDTDMPNLDISNQPLSISLLYFLLPKSMVSVYAFGGVTFTKPSIDQSGVPGPSEIIGEWHKGIFGGIGVEVPLSGSLVMHGEIQYNDLSIEITDFNLDYSGFNYSAGLTIYF